MGKRVLAAIAAVTMVLVAVVVRDRIDSEPSGSSGSGSLRLVCATELRAVCDALSGEASVIVEPATATLQRLRGVDSDDAGLDGWLVPGPWGDVLAAARPASAENLFTDGVVIARSPYVLAVWKTKRAALGCGDPFALGCVGDAVNTRGFRLGMPNDEEAAGVLADAALSAGHAGNADFATNDLAETDLADWLTTLDASADRVGRNPGGRSLAELLTFGVATADGYFATEAEIGPQLFTAAKRDQLDLLHPRPGATADVTFFARDGERGERLRRIVVSDRVRTALNAGGWRVEGVAPVVGVNAARPLPGDDGLPSGGVLLALTEITR